MQSSPASAHFLHLKSKYFPYHTILKYPPFYAPPLLWETYVSYPYKTTGKIKVLYFYLWEETGIQKALNRMHAINICISHTQNSLAEKYSLMLEHFHPNFRSLQTYPWYSWVLCKFR
jgi:hypothetical protein